MRIDCYNACECAIGELECGDTFYYQGTVCIKVRTVNIPYMLEKGDCAYVFLDTGDLNIVKGDTKVILADTKVVANTKDVAF